MNFIDIKKRYLENEHDESVTELLRVFSNEILKYERDEILQKVKTILKKPSKFMESVREEKQPVEIGNIQFSCDGCGKGCQQFSIGLSIHDLLRFAKNGHEYILPFITLSKQRPVFKLFNKKDFKGIEMIYPPRLLEQIKMINPILENLDGSHLDGCIFFNDDTRKCTIYDLRPLECKLYPIGNILNGLDNVICREECFDEGKKVARNRFHELYDKKRVSDVAFSALYNLNPQGGWRLDVFKLSLLFDQIAYVLD